MKIKTNREELDINFQEDILISKHGISIDDNKNEEGKTTYLRNAGLIVLPIKRWHLRNVKQNLLNTLTLIKQYWKQ
ncbi:hypothetical protein PQ701_04255 [Staphylococcus coagulans]|uniref:hypothetical protein n=1 Tax=Staphylococcus coagulans TaxID=74706 RepID=UPI002927BA6D|nr:hypothetical protein [Staphylococcus coagulans]MDU9304434.1 hypothetical protein [Staphylococcus coagulans]